MRACAGGYYANLLRMYAHLGIPLHPVRFLFVFARALASPVREAAAPADAGTAPGSYFVHASNLHQTPPPRPSALGLVAYALELLCLVVCHFWFSTVCFLVPPRPARAAAAAETLADYLARTWLPRRYVSRYLLPLMSSVSTCDHAEMMAFPASDVIAYKRLSHAQQHYAVCGGVRRVQLRLVQGVHDVRLGCRVVVVEPGDGVCVRWQSDAGAAAQTFDRVVLAVSPDVVGRIFRPLAADMARMPTRWVESTVLSPRPGLWAPARGDADVLAACAHDRDARPPPSHVITLRTRFGDGARTEALHAMPSGLVVSTSPLEPPPPADAKAVLQAAGFTRTLRSPASQALTRRLLGLDSTGDAASRKATGREAAPGDTGWTNGDGNVWLAGSWCWDGMVLLEGCVVSAMAVANALGVRIPWA